MSAFSDISFDKNISILPAPGQWDFGIYFNPLKPGSFADKIRAVGDIVEQAEIGKHPFFALASHNRSALNLWASQEAVVTNAFSQLLMLCCSQLGNVHARAAFLPVITGEHHRLIGGIAERSHPWLLKILCTSLGIDLTAIQPAQCTIKFLQDLTNQVANVFSGLGALGIGNERMLVPEYAAIGKAFSLAAPEASYSDFLQSNISEDVAHDNLLQDIAKALIHTKDDFEIYQLGAHTGVKARVDYYDQLFDLARRCL